MPDSIFVNLSNLLLIVQLRVLLAAIPMYGIIDRDRLAMWFFLFSLFLITAYYIWGDWVFDFLSTSGAGISLILCGLDIIALEIGVLLASQLGKEKWTKPLRITMGAIIALFVFVYGVPSKIWNLLSQIGISQLIDNLALWLNSTPRSEVAIYLASVFLMLAFFLRNAARTSKRIAFSIAVFFLLVILVAVSQSGAGP